ncbi:MAG: hypothetical protein EOO77_35470 [Oxalobacteraceae bacterium]|nr:MAG: hypothetical protein EOO77_35470 [Oxalobacteraceae bacterium]
MLENKTLRVNGVNGSSGNIVLRRFLQSNIIEVHDGRWRVMPKALALTHISCDQFGGRNSKPILQRVSAQ